MKWRISDRADKRALPLADRHYNRQKIGSAQFVPPGSCLVLLLNDADAYWVTSWPKAEYVKHDWPGAWVCSAFRNESGQLATELIRDAVSATRWYYLERCKSLPPDLGMVTFLSPMKVEPILTHGVPTFGRTWIKAGFKYVGRTKGNLLAFQMTPKQMPLAKEPMPEFGHLLLS